MTEQQVKSIGLKQAEIGLIPSDWQIKRLKEISPSQSVGLVINPSSYYSSRGTVPMLVGSHVNENKIDWTNANLITSECNTGLPASRLNSGDLVTVRVGEPGVTAVIPEELDQANCASMMIIRKSEKFDSRWLCFLMNSRIGKSQVEGVQYGTAQKQFNIIDAVDFVFPFPTKKEQTAIANALSDVDALIQELQKLIAKKQVIKTATMQQLLTGRTRLPQFAYRADGSKKGTKQSEFGEVPEDWDAITLGEVAEVRMCKRILSYQTSKNGEIPFFKIGTFGDVPDAFISEALYLEFLTKYSYPKQGDVLISAAGTLGKMVVFDGKPSYFQDSNIVWLEIDKQRLSNEYLYQYYKVIKWASSEGSTISRLYNGIIKASVVTLPPLAEQTAIATILSDMDDEIQALEQRLSKTRQIKQGMMQELLTGKTRLI